jgi:mono/diheme cytochrome c family protein
MSRPSALAACLVGLAGLLLAACNPGPYPTDVFPEMHYSPAQRRGEPPRLSPPADAVPVSGARPGYTFDQASDLPNPVPNTPATLERAGELYRVNCAMCHGADGHGRSLVADRFRAAGAVPPVDLAGDRVRARTDGQLYWIVANGLGNMPAFGDLLGEDELWTVVRFIRRVQGG